MWFLYVVFTLMGGEVTTQVDGWHRMTYETQVECEVGSGNINKYLDMMFYSKVYLTSTIDGEPVKIVAGFSTCSQNPDE